MPLVYDLETDIRYMQGKQIGIVEGIEEGEDRKARTFVENLLATGQFTMEQISSLADVSLEFVQKVKNGLKKKKGA